ncbi:hypothetical protein WG904_12755 [Pedobacter sp. Du54]|uniref:hypothetical protein n=1 Tax=Pedobacter anseongensis TaxID=3133439 RepID=UPI0030A2B534
MQQIFLVRQLLKHYAHPNPFGLDRMEAGSVDESRYINGSVVVVDGGLTAY